MLFKLQFCSFVPKGCEEVYSKKLLYFFDSIFDFCFKILLLITLVLNAGIIFGFKVCYFNHLNQFLNHKNVSKKYRLSGILNLFSSRFSNLLKMLFLTFQNHNHILYEHKGEENNENFFFFEYKILGPGLVNRNLKVADT